MKTTASFFFLGTNCHHGSYQDAMTVFHAATALHASKPDSKVATHLFDGVGSDPGELADTHPTPGRYLYDPVNKRKVKVEAELLQGIHDLMQRVTGCLVGEGIDDLLFEATLFLGQLIQENKGKLPATVNLHGYSRGADTCVRLANLLDRLYPEIKVNLFLVDQVPGPGRLDDPDSYIIPKNVQRIDSVVMLHEYKPGFDPQDRSRYVFASPHTTKVAVKVYPGSHGQAVLQTANKKTNHVAKLLHDDFYRFCQETGSLLETDPIPASKMTDSWISYSDKPASVLSQDERFKYYNKMQQNWEEYSSGTALSTRDVLNNYSLYSQDHHLFVNQEHGELFEALYPRLYQWFYAGIEVDKDMLEEELARLDDEHPDFYANFCKVNAINDGVIPSNARKISPYFRRRLGETLVDDERSFLENALIAVINYEIQHNEIESNPVSYALRNLQQSLHLSEKLDNKAGCDHLTREIGKAVRFLVAVGEEDSYLYRQLSKVCHSVQYIDKVSSLLEKYLDDNPSLEAALWFRIAPLNTELAAIKGDNKMNFMEKLTRAKSVVASSSLQLQDYKGAEANNLGFLLKSLNQLNAPGFSETSIASDIAKKFKAYYLRNMFWDSVHKLLSYVITLPPFFSSKKSNLAEEISAELEKLENMGCGNKLEAISKVLAEGQRKLQINNEEGGKPLAGEFEKIMKTAHVQLNLEINAFPFADPKTEFNSLIFT